MKQIINISSKKRGTGKVEIRFNNFIYTITNVRYNRLPISSIEEDMDEIFPGVFIGKRAILKIFSASILIYICNFRDTIRVDVINDEGEENIYHHIGKRCINVLPCPMDKLDKNTIPLDSIHFPQADIGGSMSRCCLKGDFYTSIFHPDYSEMWDTYKKPYSLFTFEEIFHLPMLNEDLNLKCWQFCSKRNAENTEYNVSEGGRVSAELLVNEHRHGKVILRVNRDFTLSIDNGNHRTCYLKRFKDRLGISELYFEAISKNISEKRFYSNDIELSTRSYYEQLERIGISEEEARMILLEGKDSIELFNFLLKKGCINF